MGGDHDRPGVTDVPLGVEARQRGRRPGPASLLAAVPPPVLILTAGVSVQVGAGLAAKLFTEVTPTAMTGLRLWTAGIVMAVTGARGLGSGVAGVVRRRAWRDAAVVAGFGVTLAVMNYAIYQSFARIPLGIAVTIEFLGPLAVAVASSRRPLDLLWVALAGGGVALLAHTGSAAGGPAGGGRGVIVAGLAFALLSALGWAAYILLSRATGRRFPGSSGLTIAMVTAAAVITPVGVVSGRGALLHPGILAAGAAIGLLSSIIPYSLEMETLRRIPARVFGIWMSTEPAIAALVGLVVLGQALPLREWAAIGCVTVACAGAARRSGEPPQPQA